MLIKTSQSQLIIPFLKQLHIPHKKSHKGQNGKVLIIGGSSLFHTASIWAAETASHFTDIVHYTSTKENNQIFLSLKKKFMNGIVISQKEILLYVKEDNSVLIGPGMLRGKFQNKDQIKDIEKFSNIQKVKHEPTYTYLLTKYLIKNFPHKKFVFDAGSLQMLNPDWFLSLKEKPIITPHQIEFETLFNVKIKTKSQTEKIKIVKNMAKKYNCLILLKSIDDIISDGKQTIIVKGGNQGLTKGGSGDVLSGLVVSLFSKNNFLTSTVLASYILKLTAENLSKTKGYWYNIQDIINKLPETLNILMLSL